MAVTVSYEVESLSDLADHLIERANERRDTSGRVTASRWKVLEAEARGLELAASMVRDTTLRPSGVSALAHLVADFEGFPDNTLVFLTEYDGDEAVAEDETITPGEDAERVATLRQLRSITRAEQSA